MCAYSVFNTFPVYPLSAKPLILLAFCRYRYHTSLFIAPETINKLLLSFFYFNKQENNYHVKIDLNTINNIYDTSELKNISNYSLENLKDMGLEVNLNIIMPGEIIKTNVGKINNNKVQINLLDLLTQDKISTISLVSKEKTNNSFVINFIVIIILIFILYRIIRKSK